jgi:tRNA (guanine-N7-)-methyltransferase
MSNHNMSKENTAPQGESAPPQRRIRSFVRRAGRITDAQSRALERLWPSFGIEPADARAARHIDFDAAFGRCAQRVLEIGFGNGDNLAALAAAQPQRDFIGAEVHVAGVGHLLLEAERLQLRNLRIACIDAVELLERHVAPASLDEVLVLFPDPWHKSRHHKRRLIQPAFVALLASRMRTGALLQLATDWEHYALQMLEVLGASPDFENAAPTGGFAERPPWRIVTRFERRGHRLGHGVWDLSFRRR